MSQLLVQHVSYLERLLNEYRVHHASFHKDCGYRQACPETFHHIQQYQAPTTRPWNTSDLQQCRQTEAAEPQSTQELGSRLSIIPYNPTKRPRNRGRKPWMPLATILISSTPTGEQWWKEIDESGLGDIVQRGTAAQFILDWSQLPTLKPTLLPSEASDPAQSEQASLLHAAECYAQLAAHRQLTTHCVLALVNLQKLVLLSTCYVLYQMKAPKSELVRITRICFGDITEPYALQLWRVGCFINELADGLACRGWGHRATELLLIWNHSPQKYVPLSCSPKEALEYLTTMLSSDRYTQDVPFRDGWTSFFMPSFIFTVLGTKVDIARICSHLRYKHAEMLDKNLMQTPINPWRFFRFTN